LSRSRPPIGRERSCGYVARNALALAPVSLRSRNCSYGRHCIVSLHPSRSLRTSDVDALLLLHREEKCSGSWPSLAMSHLIPSSDVRVFGDHCSPIRYPHRYLYPAHVLNWRLRSIGKLFVATRTTGFTAASNSERHKSQPIRRVSGYHPTPTLSFKYKSSLFLVKAVTYASSFLLTAFSSF
jgi:hypothetical protein